jgi:phage-related protein
MNGRSLAILYKNLYNRLVTRKDSNTRIKWEGDSLEEIRSWPDGARANLGHDLNLLDRREPPLNSEPMGRSLPGVHKLNDSDRDFWYRVLYAPLSGWIYVLHCFKKKTNKIAKNDIDLARARLAQVKRRNDPQAERETKSA